MRPPRDAQPRHLASRQKLASRLGRNLLDALRTMLPGVRRRDRVDKAAEQEVIRQIAWEVHGFSQEVLARARDRPGRQRTALTDRERRAAEETELLGFARRPGSAPDNRDRARAGASRPGKAKATDQDLIRVSREVLELSREVLERVRERPGRHMADSDRDRREQGRVPRAHRGGSARTAEIRELAPLSRRAAEEKELELMELLGFVPPPGPDPAGRHRADAGPRSAAATRRPRQRERQRDDLEIGR